MLKEPDLYRCEVEFETEYNPFELGSHPLKSAERCTNKVSFIATETHPNKKDGLKGSMGLCTECAIEMIRRMGHDYAVFQHITVYQSAGKGTLPKNA